MGSFSCCCGFVSLAGPFSHDALAWDGEVEGDVVHDLELRLLVGPGSSLVEPRLILWCVVRQVRLRLHSDNYVMRDWGQFGTVIR